MTTTHLATTRARRVAPIILALALPLLGGCGSGKKAMPEAPSTATAILASPTSAPATTSIPPRPSATVNATQARRTGIADAKVLVQAQCAACHALADAGIAPAPHPIAPSLDHIGAHYTYAALQVELLDACAHPLPSKSAFSCRQVHRFVASVLTPAQRDEIVAYLLSLR